MDQKRKNEILAAMNGQVDPYKRLEILKEAIAESVNDGHKLQADQIEVLCEFATKAVNMALREILETAREMRSEVVPVKFIEYVAEQQPTAVRALWAMVDQLQVPVDYGDVPDDLSGLDASGLEGF